MWATSGLGCKGREWIWICPFQSRSLRLKDACVLAQVAIERQRLRMERLLVAEKGPAQVHLALTKLVEMCHLSEHPLALQLGIGAARAPLSVVKGLNIASAEQSRHTHP